MAQPDAPARDGGSAWPAQAALLGMVAALLLGLPLRLGGPDSRPLPPGSTRLAADPYDLDTAFNLAGEQVPLLLQEYYFFALVGDAEPEQEADELAQKLLQAAQDHDYLGMSGPDPQRNRRALLAALQLLREEPLDGLVLIYLGPGEQEAEIVEILQHRGIQPRFVTYPTQAVLL